MNLIYPCVEKWNQSDNAISHVAKCARVCYASESNSKESDSKLISALRHRNHNSMFRHETLYFIIKKKEIDNKYYKDIYNELTKYTYCDYIEWDCVNGIIYVVLNGDFYMNERFRKLIDLIAPFKVSQLEFESYKIGLYMTRHTFYIVTQISTSRELNRTSPNNIAEQSTRYVNFGKKGGITICLPYWWDDAKWFTKFIHKCYWKSCEIMYNTLLKLGFKPQDARGVLPLDAATKVVYTYSVKEWNHIIDLRYREKTGKAHPNAYDVIREVCNMLYEEGINLTYSPINK